MFEDFLIENVFEDKKLSKAIEVIKLKEGERRNVSVLFADVKGFTALSETLDSEQVQNLLDTLLKAFTYCINKYGGYVDKYEGDLVMALFGAKKASERDTKRAIYCGLEMLEQLKKFNAYLLSKPQFKDKYIDLGVRIGINTGLVVTGKVGEEREGDFTVYGDAVNVASRMESNAPINGIMIPEETMMLVESDFIFESRGEIVVKGKANPINVYLVKGKNESYAIETSKTKFIGRDYELDHVINYYNEGILKLKSSQSEQIIRPTIISIKGVAGIGKTRFLNEFIQNRLYDEGDSIVFLHGSATNLSQITYYLFIDILKRYLQVLSFETIEQTKNKLEIVIRNLSKFTVDEEEKTDLLETIPVLGFLLGIKYTDNRLTLKGQDLQLHIQHALKTFIFALAKKVNKQGYPLVIILEDLQWNDQNSSEFLNFLFRTISLIDVNDKGKAIQLLFLFTSRTDYKIQTEIEKNSTIKEIELKSLTSEYALLLIKSILGRVEIPENIKNLLLEKSEGNPFYIEEWIAMINNETFIDFKRKKFLKNVEIPIPGNLNALILSRIDHLQTQNKLLLQKSAVIGRKFSVSVLSQVETKMGNTVDILPGVKYLSENDFIQSINDHDQFQFKHILIQEVSYNTLLESNKKLLHKLIAEVIEEANSQNLNQQYYDLAFHYDRTDENEKAIHYLFEAGNKAADEYANNEAIGFLEKLINRFSLAKTQNIQKIDVLVKYADIMQFISQYKVAETRYFEAEKLAMDQDNKKQLAHIYTRLGWNYALLGDADSFEVYTYKAVSLWKDVGDEIGLAKAICNLAVVKINAFDEKTAIEFLAEQLEIFKKNGYKKETCQTLLSLGLAKFRIGELDNAMQIYNEALDIAQQIKDRKLKSILLGNIAGVYLIKKEWNNAIAQYELAIKEFRDIGFKVQIPRNYYGMAYCYYESHDYIEAEKYAQKCNDLAEEINQKDITTEAIIMLSKSRFAITEDPKIIHHLRILLKATKTPHELAYLNLEIWRMALKIKYEAINAELHRQKSLELFKELYSKSPILAFKENIEKLENNN